MSLLDVLVRGARRSLAVFFTACIFAICRSKASDEWASCPRTTSNTNRWVSLRSVDKIRLAVFPLGAIEQHGPHLPFGTDTLLAEAFGNCIAAEFQAGDVSVLPSSPFGASFEHSAFPGTLAVHDDTLQGLWGSILSGISSAGVKSCIMLNAHGGQTPNAQIAVRRARFEFKPPILAVLVNLQALIHDSKQLILDKTTLGEEEWTWESKNGIHGGLIETSLMLHLHPDLVDMSKAKKFGFNHISRKGYLEPYGTVVSYGWQAEDLFPGGAGGLAANATPELGLAIYDNACLQLAKIVAETLQSDRETMFS